MPDETPVTTPLPVPTVAIPVAPLLQAPDEVASLKVVVAPAHTMAVPAIGDGLTVTATLPDNDTDEHAVVDILIKLTVVVDDSVPKLTVELPFEPKVVVVVAPPFIL